MIWRHRVANAYFALAGIEVECLFKVATEMFH